MGSLGKTSLRRYYLNNWFECSEGISQVRMDSFRLYSEHVMGFMFLKDDSGTELSR